VREVVALPDALDVVGLDAEALAEARRARASVFHSSRVAFSGQWASRCRARWCVDEVEHALALHAASTQHLLGQLI
jgi:hypothetical protein